MPTQLPACTTDVVLRDVTEVLKAVIGADLSLQAPITMATSFNDDLCLESIQFVVLAEELRARYGDRVDFVAWLAGMDLDAIIALSVGRLVGFIVDSVNGGQGG